MDRDLLILGTTNARNQFNTFGIKQPDRLMHTYVIGKTGTEKTARLEVMVLE